MDMLEQIVNRILENAEPRMREVMENENGEINITLEAWGRWNCCQCNDNSIHETRDSKL